MILLLALFSPIAELFPNLFMSWWLPDNGDTQGYVNHWHRRVAVVLVVWLPILLTLSHVTQPAWLIWIIAALVFGAFGLRLYSFDTTLHQALKADNKTIPAVSSLPEVFYFIAFTTIGVVLFSAVPDRAWIVPLGIGLIFLGANFMGKFRRGVHKNLTWDIIGRVIFTVGFLINLWNLARAAGIL